MEPKRSVSYNYRPTYDTEKLAMTISKNMAKEIKVERLEVEIVEKRVSFWQAWLLPKVGFYAFSYFCAKCAL